MSQEEARKLLDAWAFFDKHPEAKSWEGMPRPEFYRLVQIIAGTDNLVDAKEYFEGVAAGTITGDMPTALLEAQKEGQDISTRLSTSKSASRVTKGWLAKLSTKSAEEVAEKQVAAAQVRAVVERAEEETPALKEVPKPKATKTVVPSSAETPPSAPATTPSTPVEEGLSIKISSGAFGSFEQMAGKAAGTPLAIISMFSPPKSSMTPQTSAAVSSALSLSQVAQRAEKLPEADREHILSLVNNLRKAEFSFVQQTRLLSVREITILSGSEFGMDQESIVALLGGGRGIPERGPSFVARVGQQLFGSIAKKAASKAIAGALTKAGISVAGKAVAGAVGQAAIPIPGVGFIVGQIIDWIANKAVDLASRVAIWIKEHGKEVVGGLLIGGGILIGGFAGLAAGIAGGAIALGGSGLSTIASGIGSFFSFIFTGIILPSIGIPILVALFAVPAVIVIILFIINSSAYIVPPRTGFISGENPYIGVEKVASPTGPFSNDDLFKTPPIVVEYTITITAKKGTLTNISFAYDCEVIKKGSTEDCPNANLVDSQGKAITIGPQANLRISPTEPYKITYQAQYSGGRFQDSAIIDTLTVTADAAEQNGAQASGGAAVIIGNPPTGCFRFDDSWPANLKANEVRAITELTRASVYMTRLCAAGEIVLKYGGNNGGVGGDVIAGPNIITIYSAGVQYGPTSTLYTTTHESGHIFARRYGGIFRQYADTPGVGNVLICTYPFNNSVGESFPEMIGLFVANSPGHAPINLFGCLGGSFKTKYPAHWQFARNVIFQQDLGW
ncbi:hypothetical protein MUP46_01380 [Patescibacteria group bacterium]|nr:hypothetical protein [Patescibacteria group bacterium]